MSRRLRIMISIRPFLGHFHPIVPLAKALRQAGHEVAVATATELAGDVAAAGLPWRQAGIHPATAQAAFIDDPDVDYGYRSVAMKVSDLLQLFTTFRPDVIVREPTDLAPAVAAEVIGIPCANFGISHFIHASTWFILGADEAIAALRRDYGLRPDRNLQSLYEGLYIAIVPPELEQFDPLPLADVQPMAYSAWDGAGDGVDSPEWLKYLQDRPTVLATLGTVDNAHTDVLATILDALADEEINVICTIGTDQQPSSLGPVPANARVERYLPHSLVLPYCQAIICHMGFNTMMGALCAGVPLVGVPLASDQTYNSTRCRELGFSVEVPSTTLTAASVCNAVSTVLSDNSYVQNVNQFRASVAALPTLTEVVRRLERVAAET